MRSVPFKQITDNRYSLPQTCVLQQKHQSQALSAHIFSFDLEQMQKNSFSRWLSITQPAPMTPQLFTKVVFTQQIKRRLRLITFFISPVIVVSKSFGCTSIFVHVRPLLPFPIGQRASLAPKVVLMKALLLQQKTGHILHLL